MKNQHKYVLAMFFVVTFVIQGFQMYSPDIEYEDFLRAERQKYPELDPEKLDRIKNLAKANDKLPPINRKEYVLFLHSANFDENEAYRMLVKYYDVQKKLPHIFGLNDPTEEELNKVFDIMSHSILYTENEDKGIHYLYTQFNITNAKPFKFADQAKYYFLMVKCLLVEYGTFDGVVVIWNLAGLNYWHLRKIKIFYKNQIIRLLWFIQYNAPLRIKEAHILNSGRVTSYAYAKVKYLLNKEFRKKIHFHRPGSKEVFKFVPKEVMPLDFEGGRGLSHSEQSETTLELMKSLRGRYMSGDVLSSDHDDEDEHDPLIIK